MKRFSRILLMSRSYPPSVDSRILPNWSGANCWAIISRPLDADLFELLSVQSHTTHFRAELFFSHKFDAIFLECNW